MKFLISILGLGFLFACSPVKVPFFKNVPDTGLRGKSEGKSKSEGKGNAEVRGKSEGKGKPGMGSGDPIPHPGPDLPSEPRPDVELIPGCERFSREFVFVEYNQGCNWNVDGNLGPKSGYLQAMHKQSFRVNMMAHSRICSMRISSEPDAKFLYNDAMVFSVENHVLATSEGWIKDFLPTSNGGLVWNWDAVKGKAKGNVVNANQPLCYGDSSTCRIPARGAERTLDVFIPEAELANFSPSIQGKRTLMFDLWIGGDGANLDAPTNDCYSKEIRFRVDMQLEP